MSLRAARLNTSRNERNELTNSCDFWGIVKRMQECIVAHQQGRVSQDRTSLRGFQQNTAGSEEARHVVTAQRILSAPVIGFDGKS